MNALARHRRLAHQLLLGLCWTQLAGEFVLAWAMGGPWLQLCGAAAAAAALATAATLWRRGGDAPAEPPSRRR